MCTDEEGGCGLDYGGGEEVKKGKGSSKGGQNGS